MARIYISSTSKDLEECREKVRIALRRMGHEDIAMEYYVAGHKRPLDKCLEDVASCDLYVGIFAWRYGYTPDGEDKSFSELEYRKAVEIGIECLIFLLDEDASSWPPKFVDIGKDGEKIRALRNELSTKHMVSFFKSADELPGLISTAVHNWEIEHRTETPKANKELLSNYNPSNLPYYPERLKKFVTANRADKLKNALTYLENHRILLISGVGGVGKTTLARALIDLRPANVPVPFWFSLYDNQDAKLGDILEKLAAYMNAPEIVSFKAEKREPGKTDIDRLIGELHKRSEIWLIFDDLSMILGDQYFTDKGTELLFSSFQSKTHNAKVIITSRILPMLENGENLIDVVEDEKKQHLNGLRKDFAENYLASNGLDKIEHGKLEELALGVDGHPLALKLLVELVKEFGANDILEDLSIYQKQKENTIKKARRLFDKLVGDEKKLLERISVYREPVGIKGIKEVLTEDIPKNAVKKLIDKSLLETDHNGSYWLHPLVQEFSYGDLEDKKKAHLFAVKYYLSLPLPANPSRKEDVQPLIEANHHACAAKEYDAAAEVIFHFELYEKLEKWGNYNTLIELYKEVLPKNHFEDKPLLKNEEFHRAVLGNLGNIYVIQNDKKAIQYREKAIEIYKESTDKFNEVKNISNMGLAYFQQGMMKKAIECYERALKISRYCNQKDIEGGNLGNIGLVYLQIGESKKAIDYFEKSLPLLREVYDKRREGVNIGYMGLAYLQLGEAEKAIQYIEQALYIAKEINDKRSIGVHFGNIGNAYFCLGEMKLAIEYYEQALSIAKEIDDRSNFGNWLGNIGRVYFHFGDIERAIEYYKQALKIAEELHDIVRERVWIYNFGQIYNYLGEFKKSVEYYEQELKILREIGNRQEEGNCLGNLGLAYNQLGERRKAIEFLKESLAIGKAIEDTQIITFYEQKLKELEGFNE